MTIGIAIKEQNDKLQEPFVFPMVHGAITDKAASLNLDTPTTNCETVVEAAIQGASGNSVTLQFIAGSLVNAGVYNEAGYPAITFTFKTAVTTVGDFEAAVTASTKLKVRTVDAIPATALVVGQDVFGPTSFTGGSDVGTAKVYKATRAGAIDRVQYINPTGRTADPTHYFVLQVKKGSTVLASWSTQTGAVSQGAIAADTFVTLVNAADTGFDAGDTLSIDVVEHGSTNTLAAGMFVIEGRLN